MNRLKTLILLAGMTALFMWVGQLLGGRSGVMFAFIFAGVMNIGAYWFSDKIVLATQGARAVTEEEAPVLYQIVRDLASRAQMPLPKIYMVQADAPNAFATGRNPNHAAVAVTTGLMSLVTEDELMAVLAHELSHVQNRDTLIMAVAATVAGALSHLANMAMWGMMGRGRSSDREGNSNPLIGLVGIILAPIAAMLIQMAISRTREFGADDSGARLCGQPLALASALKKIESWSQRIPLESATPAMSHLYIINPLTGENFSRMFSTHPSTAARVKKLEAMADRPELTTVR